MKRPRGGVLAILAGEDPEGPLSYAQIKASRSAAAAHGILAPDQRGGLPASAPGRTVLILPASLGRLLRVVLPARTEAQARAAAPFLLEDVLATDASALHFAVGEAQDEQGTRLLAVMDRAILAQFLERCRRHGADPQIVVFDCAALRPLAGEARAVENDDRLVIGADGQGGVSLEPALGRALAARWLQALGEPVRTVSYIGHDPEGFQAVLQGVAQVRVEPFEPLLEVLAIEAMAATAIIPNLRQGEFSSQNARSKAYGRGWRIAAFFAAAAILAQAAVQGVSGHRDMLAAAALTQQAEADFRVLQPDFPAGGDVGATVRALMNRAARAQAHPVLKVSGPLTEALRAEPNARLESLTHEAGAKAVQIVLSSAVPQAIDTVAETMRGRGFTVTMGERQQGILRTTQTMLLEPVG